MVAMAAAAAAGLVYEYVVVSEFQLAVQEWRDCRVERFVDQAERNQLLATVDLEGVRLVRSSTLVGFSMSGEGQKVERCPHLLSQATQELGQARECCCRQRHVQCRFVIISGKQRKRRPSPAGACVEVWEIRECAAEPTEPTERFRSQGRDWDHGLPSRG